MCRETVSEANERPIVVIRESGLTIIELELERTLTVKFYLHKSYLGRYVHNLRAQNNVIR